MDKFGIILYWSNEDQLFIAEVPELPGCSAHGKTRLEALERVDEAMELWIKTAHEFEDPIPSLDELNEAVRESRER